MAAKAHWLHGCSKGITSLSYSSLGLSFSVCVCVSECERGSGCVCVCVSVCLFGSQSQPCSQNTFTHNCPIIMPCHLHAITRHFHTQLSNHHAMSFAYLEIRISPNYTNTFRIFIGGAPA